jgi:hypothetical protein
MLLLVGTVLGFLLAGSAFLVVRGLVGLFRRRPKAALATLGGVGLFVAVVILLGAASFLLGPSTEAADSSAEKARVLSKNISALMNLSFPRPAVRHARRHRRGDPSPEAVQHAVAAAEGRQLSVDGQRAGAARLMRMSVAAARSRQCYCRPSPTGLRC